MCRGGMEAVSSPLDLAVDAALHIAFRSVPCKKRPLSWYKPPASPEEPRGPGSPGSPASPASPRSPGSPASSTSSTTLSHEDSMPPYLSVRPHSSLVMWPGPADGHPQLAAAPRTSPPVRRQSDFSIEHILRDAGPHPGPRPGPSTSPHRASEPQPREEPAEGPYEWLHCTRYRPPKLPRSRRREGPAQRRLGRNPRIPFSPQQVAALEGRFRRSHYLSSTDVAELSAQLQLSETRVKIWFQNRRARERRDGEGRSTESPPQLSPQPRGQTLPQAPTPSQLPRSPISAFTAPKSQLRSYQEQQLSP